MTAQPEQLELHLDPTDQAPTLSATDEFHRWLDSVATTPGTTTRPSVEHTGTGGGS